MALYKEIELANGIKITYHRIASLVKITNNKNIIEIASYIDKEKRKKEKEEYKNGIFSNVFISTSYISKEYNDVENITDIYEYLKETEEFKDSKNI